MNLAASFFGALLVGLPPNISTALSTHCSHLWILHWPASGLLSSSTHLVIPVQSLVGDPYLVREPIINSRCLGFLSPIDTIYGETHSPTPPSNNHRCEFCSPLLSCSQPPLPPKKYLPTLSGPKDRKELIPSHSALRRWASLLLPLPLPQCCPMFPRLWGHRQPLRHHSFCEEQSWAHNFKGGNPSGACFAAYKTGLLRGRMTPSLMKDPGIGGRHILGLHSMDDCMFCLSFDLWL